MTAHVRIDVRDMDLESVIVVETIEQGEDGDPVRVHSEYLYRPGIYTHKAIREGEFLRVSEQERA